MSIHLPQDQPPADLVPHTGMWGTVAGVDLDEVTVAIREFDGGQHAFGPVPFTPPDADPGEGDRVFLHFDSQQRPAYAVIFG